MKCGYVAIIGRPNVGKSTLLNHILGQKISITSRKPQTTRHRILGIKTFQKNQVIYIDTPGLHRGIKHALNKYMNRVADQALEDVDVVGFMVDGLHWTEEDEWILEKFKKNNCPVVLIINKVDKIQSKDTLLPHLGILNKKYNFVAVVPLSAKKNDNIIVLEKVINELLPEGPHYFPEDEVTDRSDRFLASEFIREKLMRSLQQELPYAIAVEIEEFKTQDNILRISAIIWLERENQKGIVIGKGGQLLKHIGEKARLDMERAFGKKVFLKLWTKVKERWSTDERILRSLGYDE